MNVKDLNDALAQSLEPGAVLLPAGMTIREGQSLWEGMKFGRLLGAGVQARVFELVRTDGSPSGRVIKVSHADLGHKLLNNSVVSIGNEREWEIGIQMRIALQQEDGSLPGFMRVYDCVVVESGGKTSFNGMTMEKLQGWDVRKRLLEPDFHNIHYVREMLYQTFMALSAAQRKLGFHHADLGMRNVMECYPQLFTDVSDKEIAKSQAALKIAESSGSDNEEISRHGNALANGGGPGEEGTSSSATSPLVAAAEAAVGAVTAAAEAVTTAVVAGTGATEGGTRGDEATPADTPPPSTGAPESAGGSTIVHRSAHTRVRHVRGFTCSSRGEMMPLGPQVEFKIIDYGLAIFDERLAESTGGTQYKQVMHKIRNVLAAKEVVFPSRSGNVESPRTLPLDTSTSKIGRATHAWHLLPTRLKGKFRVKQTPVGAYPVVSDASFTEPPAGMPRPNSRRSQRYVRPSNATRRLMRTSGFVLDDPLANPQTKGDTIDAVNMSAVESLYRSFWRRKGDVFHILLSVGIALDNRVWPKHDEELVHSFISLVFHCTGVKIKASFAVASSESGTNNLYGTLDRAQSLQEMTKQKLEKQTGSAEGKRGDGSSRLRNFGIKRKWYRPIRRFRMIMKAHLHPFNSGMTANEALVAPFFGRCDEIPAAKVPVDVEAVFPGVCYSE